MITNTRPLTTEEQRELMALRNEIEEANTVGHFTADFDSQCKRCAELTAIETAHREAESLAAWNITKRPTVAELKAATVILDPPIYMVKPYIVTNSEGVVLMAGTMEQIKRLGVYFDAQFVDIRRNDLHQNDNTKISTDVENMASHTLADFAAGMEAQLQSAAGCLPSFFEGAVREWQKALRLKGRALNEDQEKLVHVIDSLETFIGVLVEGGYLDKAPQNCQAEALKQRKQLRAVLKAIETTGRP